MGMLRLPGTTRVGVSATARQAAGAPTRRSGRKATEQSIRLSVYHLAVPVAVNINELPPFARRVASHSKMPQGAAFQVGNERQGIGPMMKDHRFATGLKFGH